MSDKHERIATTKSEQMLMLAAGAVVGLYVVGLLAGLLFGLHPNIGLLHFTSVNAIWGISNAHLPIFVVAYVLTLITVASLFFAALTSFKITQGKKGQVHFARHNLNFKSCLPFSVGGGAVGAIVGGFASMSWTTAVAFGVSWALIAGFYGAWRRGETVVPDDRFVLGHQGKEGQPGSMWVTSPKGASSLIISTTQGRKTSNILIPCLLSVKGSAVFTSTKSDFLEKTYRWRSSKGTEYFYDPMMIIGSLPEGVKRLQWSPLTTNWQVAFKHADHFTESTGSAVTNGNFWKDSARRLVQLTFYGAALGKLPLSQVPELADEADLRTLGSIIGKRGNHESQMALKSLVTARELKSIQSQAGTGLALFHTDTIKQPDSLAKAQTWISA
jgi:hypothetical protein